jgi:hypothetical protein
MHTKYLRTGVACLRMLPFVYRTCIPYIDGSFRLADGRIVGVLADSSDGINDKGSNGGIRVNTSTAHFNRLVHTLETERNSLRTKLHARKKV